MLRALIFGLIVLATGSASAGDRRRVERAKTANRLSREGKRHAGAALRAYKTKGTLPNGLVYGESMRDLHLVNMDRGQIHDFLVARGFTREVTVLRNPDTNRPILDKGTTIPVHIYTHRDGGTVRLKPLGVPRSALMKQPHYSKGLRWPHDASGDGFEHEALKVDARGQAVPRLRKELRVPPNVNRQQFVSAWARRAHGDLTVGE